MNRLTDGFLRSYDKYEHHTHGIYQISLDEVANALGSYKGFDSNMRPYQRTLHELTNEYLVANREFITVPAVGVALVQTDDDRITYKYNMRFYTKHALLLIALLCDKRRKRNWLDNESLMEDHKSDPHRITSITDRKLVEDSEDSEQTLS